MQVRSERPRAAIHAATQGSTVLGRGASAPVVVAATRLPDANPLAALDSRDREILALLVEGLGPAEVAQRLFLAPKTIRNRVSTMLLKLGVTTREEAIALGVAGSLGSAGSQGHRHWTRTRARGLRVQVE